MTTIKQHLDKYKKKAHRTQKKNGQYLKMTIARLSLELKLRNAVIKELRAKLEISENRLPDSLA